MNFRKATRKIFAPVIFFSFFTTYAAEITTSLQEENEKQANILAQQEERKQVSTDR